MSSELTAVVWDFDGTLVDTRAKNLNVTRALVERVKGAPAETFPALRSLEEYERALHRHVDWKGFYRLELDMSEQEMLDAGSQWMDYQLRDRTAASFYEGIPEVLAGLPGMPHGIVSLNARDNILRFLAELGLDHYFAEVLGYEAVSIHRQKPCPDALVMCIERLTGARPGRVLFVGDHETDVQCAHNATRHFRELGLAIEVLSVGALYGPAADANRWSTRPHFEARTAREILDVVSELPASARAT